MPASGRDSVSTLHDEYGTVKYYSNLIECVDYDYLHKVLSVGVIARSSGGSYREGPASQRDVAPVSLRGPRFLSSNTVEREQSEMSNSSSIHIREWCGKGS